MKNIYLLMVISVPNRGTKKAIVIKTRPYENLVGYYESWNTLGRQVIIMSVCPTKKDAYETAMAANESYKSQGVYEDTNYLV